MTPTPSQIQAALDAVDTMPISSGKLLSMFLKRICAMKRLLTNILNISLLVAFAIVSVIALRTSFQRENNRQYQNCLRIQSYGISIQCNRV